MASLTRVLQNLFGVSHGTNEVAQFGSLAAGSPQYTDDPALIQALNQFAEGLFSVTGSGSQAPRIEDFNGLLLLLFRQLKYLFQAGIPEWLATENYYSDKSLVTRNGKVYICLTGTDVAPCVNIDPATDNGTNWAIFWAKNNQGSGSGLDADLWDATHRPSGFGNANQSGFSPVTADVLTTLTQVGSAGYFATGSTNTPGGDYYSIICIGGTNSTGAQFLAYGATSGKFYIGNQTAADVITWGYLWNAMNMGSGSGLDADLWDATHRPSGFGNANQSGFSPVTADVLTTLTQVGSAGYFATGSTNTPGGDYYSIICIGGTNSTGAQFLAYGATSGKFYIGNQTAADVITWGYLWNAMNMGSGSGLDSDTVDGKHLSDLVAMFFGASSAGSFGTGDISAVPLESGSFFLGYQVTSLPEAANGRLIRFILDSNTGVDFFITDARDTWVRTLSGGAWGTWGIFWTSAKQGSGSGMDADTVDGLHANVSPGTTGLLRRTLFNAPGTYSYTTGPNTTVVFLTGVAGGGSGAPGWSNISGGGGEAGQWVVKKPVAVTPNTTYSVIVGAGGAPTGGNPGDGMDGNPTSFGALLTLPSGQKGFHNGGPGTGQGLGGNKRGLPQSMYGLYGVGCCGFYGTTPPYLTTGSAVSLADGGFLTPSPDVIDSIPGGNGGTSVFAPGGHGSDHNNATAGSGSLGSGGGGCMPNSGPSGAGGDGFLLVEE